MKSLSQATGISLNTMKQYLNYLSDATLLSLLYVPEKGIKGLDKPEKIDLQNTSLTYSLADSDLEVGHIGRTFFMSQAQSVSKIDATPEGDFLVDGKYLFEVGGKSKQQHQIAGAANGFIVKDDIELETTTSISCGCLDFYIDLKAATFSKDCLKFIACAFG